MQGLEIGVGGKPFTTHTDRLHVPGRARPSNVFVEIKCSRTVMNCRILAARVLLLSLWGMCHIGAGRGGAVYFCTRAQDEVPH